ncbi:potassium transporter TrkG [Falsirhodobacter sp. alg1]|uniref:potassium transporter TrkG n=1 Tax=Falsirhodobacter sp. alg1 TaxID=1472418 RepID=UPI0005EDF10C|nr:potassium transporter TrkG [Falsirhodobacter sp. alg1]
MASVRTVPMLIWVLGVGALAMFLPAAHGLVRGHMEVSRAFFYSGTLFLIFAGMMALATANYRPTNLARNHLASLVGAYLIVPVMLAVPFQWAVGDTSFFNAWFEMLSSFTTTGATLYDRPDRLSDTLHLWRALVGWLGGFFVILNAVAVLAPLNLGGIEVLSGRAPGRQNLKALIEVAEPAERMFHHAIRLLPAYGGLTLVLWVILLAMGENGLFALSYAMGTLSTSGIYPGVDYSHMPGLHVSEIAVFAFLTVAITRRMLPGRVLIDRSARLRDNPEVRFAAMLMLTAPTVLVLRHWLGQVDYIGGIGEFSQAMWGSLFTTLSFMTTTGYVSGGWDVARGWSGLDSSGLILLGLAVVGGGVGTAAGGVTLLRVYALSRHSHREMQRIIHPSSIGGGSPVARRLRRDGAYVAWIFIMLFGVTAVVAMLLLGLVGMRFEPAVILTMSALTTAGPLASVAGEVPIFWSAQTDVAKFILGITMIFGRVETLVVLALLAPSSWRR